MPKSLADFYKAKRAAREERELVAFLKEIDNLHVVPIKCPSCGWFWLHESKKEYFCNICGYVGAKT